MEIEYKSESNFNIYQIVNRILVNIIIRSEIDTHTKNRIEI